MDTLRRTVRDAVLRYGGDGGKGNYPIFGEGGVVPWRRTALARIANHILGGARFGTDRKDSVLDLDCRAWDFDNLYVTDGGVHADVREARIRPLTIQANSFRVADHLLTRV